MNESGPYISAEWVCAHKRKKINEDPNFWSNGCAQKKDLTKEDQIFLSNGGVQIKGISQW